MQTSEESSHYDRLDRDLIEQRVRAMFEARSRGDVDSMATFLAPWVVVEMAGTPPHYHVSRRLVGVEAFWQHIRGLNIEYEHIEQKIRMILVDGSKVSIRRALLLRHRGSGRIQRLEACDWLRFDQGMVVELVAYTDTATLSEFLADENI